jgi:hypothetical protein
MALGSGTCASMASVSQRSNCFSGSPRCGFRRARRARSSCAARPVRRWREGKSWRDCCAHTPPMQMKADPGDSPTVIVLASGRGERFVAAGGTGSKLRRCWRASRCSSARSMRCAPAACPGTWRTRAIRAWATRSPRRCAPRAMRRLADPAGRPAAGAAGDAAGGGRRARRPGERRAAATTGGARASGRVRGRLPPQLAGTGGEPWRRARPAVDARHRFGGSTSWWTTPAS